MAEVSNALDFLYELGIAAGSKIILALLIYLIGKPVIKKVLKIIEKSKGFAKLDPTVRSFIMNAARICLYVVMVVAIIDVLGVKTTSIITFLASCGVAVGLAMQGALSNIAGGLMLLLTRPFSVGDFISASGEEGTVRSISLFYTVLNTVDNKKVTIPNGALMNANIRNCSSEELRRVDLTFNLTGADIEKTQKVMLDTIAANELVLKDPEPFAAPVAGIPGGLEYTVRAWTKSENYWTVYFALLKDIVTALGEAGVGAPLAASKVIVEKPELD